MQPVLAEGNDEQRRNRRRLPGNGLIGVWPIREQGMKHPLLTDTGGCLSGALPDAVIPFWNVGPA
jgi:hypothetical protein